MQPITPLDMLLFKAIEIVYLIGCLEYSYRVIHKKRIESCPKCLGDLKAVAVIRMVG